MIPRRGPGFEHFHLSGNQNGGNAADKRLEAAV
jgi:hypothetical protein